MSWKLSRSVNSPTSVESLITGRSIDFERWLPTTSAVARNREANAAMTFSKSSIWLIAAPRHNISGATVLNFSMSMIGNILVIFVLSANRISMVRTTKLGSSSDLFVVVREQFILHRDELAVGVEDPLALVDAAPFW